MIKVWSLSTRFFILDFVGAISVACYIATFELKRDIHDDVNIWLVQ